MHNLWCWSACACTWLRSDLQHTLCSVGQKLHYGSFESWAGWQGGCSIPWQTKWRATGTLLRLTRPEDLLSVSLHLGNFSGAQLRSLTAISNKFHFFSQIQAGTT